ncbi:MAG: SHOCT domain-containing protein [Bacteroidales bacterium]
MKKRYARGEISHEEFEKRKRICYISLTTGT